MDFIEQLFHISPDGGNGAFEAVFYAVVFGVMAVPASAVVRAVRRRRSR